jgi:hypothetical protein
MSMTNDEITADVTTRWVDGNLGLYQKAISWYLVEMKNAYAQIAVNHFEDEVQVSKEMLNILSFTWAVLRWYEDFPPNYPPWFFPPITGGTVGASPRPSVYDMDQYPLEVTGVTWTGMDKQEFDMMVSTYINQLTEGWLDDTATLWSTASKEAAQHLFEVCTQYLTQYGLYEGETEID